MAENPCHFCAYDLNGVPLRGEGVGERMCPECGKMSPPGPPAKPLIDFKRWRVPMVIGAAATACLAAAVVMYAYDPFAVGFLVICGSAAVGLLTGVLSAMWWMIALMLGNAPRPPSIGEEVWRMVFRGAMIALIAAVLCFLAAVVVSFAAIVAR